MRKILIAAVTTTAVLGLSAQDASAWVPPCRDLAPREAVVRVHLRCDHAVVEPPQRLDLVITKPDAPPRWRDAWGGDGSLAWAERELNRLGCAPITFVDGWKAIGRDCDY